MENDYSQYIETSIREGRVEIEYDGFMKNNHTHLK